MGCATRRLIILLVLASIAAPAFGAKKITVAQLEQLLRAQKANHKSDLETSKQVSNVELSERLTEDSLSRLRELFASDSRTCTALLLLADRSAFLDPPPNELPANPPLDVADQQHLLDLAQMFALQTLPRLPNLIATRTTFSFDDSPQELTKGAYPQRAGIHLIGSTKAEVSVYHERSYQLSGAKPGPSGGLSTWGEFGSALLIILSDAKQGKTSWSHWEKTPAGTMAVFRYAVPKSSSHYEIVTSLEEMQAQESARWAGSRARDAAPVTMSSRIIRSKPAYAGSLWIDPASGVITRLTLIADLKGNPKFERGAVLVEYGPVQVANKTLICPLRSLALSEAPTSVNTVFSGMATEWLNENIFADYHLFSSSARIVTEEAGTVAPAQPGAAPSGVEADANSPPTGSQVSPAETAREKQTELPAANAPSEAAIADSQPAQAQDSPGAAPLSASAQTGEGDRLDRVRPESRPAAVVPEVSPAPQVPSKDQPTVADNSGAQLDIPEDAAKLRIETQEVLVPVVVRDKAGHAVGSLTKDDFVVFDEEKPRAIIGFSVIESNKSHRQEQTGGLAPTAAVPDATGLPAAAPNRFIVFLFDDRHISISDLAIVQKAVGRMLDEPLAATDYAAVLSMTGANSGITQNRALLKQAMMRVSVHQVSQHVAEDCPDIDYYSADKIIHQHDPLEFQLAVLKAKKCSHLNIFQPSSSPGDSGVVSDPGDPFQRMAMAVATREVMAGEEDAHQSLVQIGAVIRAMAKLQGQRILILLSPGFLSLAPDAIAFKSQVLNEAAGANVVINALDARGLYTGNVDASQGEAASLSQTLGQTSSDHLAGMQASENAMAELANGTGGTFFHNSNDLLGGMKVLTAAPEYMYLLGISMHDVKANGTFHRLKVRVDKQHLDVQARRGYFAPKH